MEAIVATLVASAFAVGLVIFSKTKKGKKFFGYEKQHESV